MSERVLTRDRVGERESIPFRTIVRKTPTLDVGVRKVAVPGRSGLRVQIVTITWQDGVEADREVVRTFVKRRPVARVVLLGTRVKPKPTGSRCDPRYCGACVPIASDVDCGSGNGPAYVWGDGRGDR